VLAIGGGASRRFVGAVLLWFEKRKREIWAVAPLGRALRAAAMYWALYFFLFGGGVCSDVQIRMDLGSAGVF